MFPEIQSMRDTAQRTLVDKSTPGYRRSRRNEDGAKTRALIVDTCRKLMVAGRFHPSRRELILGGDLTRKQIVYHFQSLPDLWEEALEDEATRVGFVDRILVDGELDRSRLIRAVLLGRLVTT